MLQNSKKREFLKYKKQQKIQVKQAESDLLFRYYCKGL